MRISITGGNGFIGSTLIANLLESKNHEITIFSNKKLEYTNQISRYKYNVVLGNLCEDKVYAEMVDSDIIFHLAQINLGTSKDIASDLLINSLSTGYIVQQCIKRKINPLVVLASTNNILRSKNESPPSIWSLHKKFSEQYLNFYRDNYGGRVTVVRISNVYGFPVNLNKYENSSLNRMYSMALNGSIKLFNNSHKKRAYIHVQDLVNCLQGLIHYKNIKNNILYAAENRLLSYEEIATILEVKSIQNQIKLKIIRDRRLLSLIEMQDDNLYEPNIFRELNINPLHSVENYLKGER